MKIYSLGQISPEEKSDILEKHRRLYDGYRTMHPEVSNTQPLYTQDFANDKNGITVSNKGNVMAYTNIGINEQTSKKEVCSECGGGMMEGECMECGWKGGMEEQTPQVKALKHEKDLGDSKFDYVEGEFDEQLGTQGNPYGDEKPAYDFVSGGPGKAFREDFDGEDDEDGDLDDILHMTSAFDDDEDSFDDVYDDELDNPEASPIDFVGDEDEMSLGGEDEMFFDDDEDDWEELDDDIRESFVEQKNLVVEMMNRMNKFK